MLERDLQDYLFENPDILFPGEIISRKRGEVFIQGRRIDLLFEIDEVQFIVELKRETIGQSWKLANSSSPTFSLSASPP